MRGAVRIGNLWSGGWRIYGERDRVQSETNHTRKTMSDDYSDHNLPQVQFSRQVREWQPFTSFREALGKGDVAEALRLNAFLTLTQETVSAHHALLLTFIEDSEWWKRPTGGHGPYESFAECATDLTGRGMSTCGDLMRCWRFWRKKRKTQEEWIRHCQLIGWTACREIRFADIPSDEIETVVMMLPQAAMKQAQIRGYLAQYKPDYHPREEQWTRWQVKCSAEGREQLEAIFDDLAATLGIDRTSAGANDRLVAALHALYFQGKDAE